MTQEQLLIIYLKVLNNKIMRYIKTLLLVLLSANISYSQIDRTQPPKPGPAPIISLGNPKSFTLKNGLKVIVVENDKLPRAYANLDIDNYPDYEGDIKGVSNLLGSMMGNGTKNQEKDSYNEEVDYMGATLFLSAGGGYASSLKRYFPRILEMMSDGLINPVFTKEDFQKEKNVILDGIKSIEKDVQTIASRVHSKLRYGANHPFGEFESAESINNVTLKDVKNYYSTYAIPNNAYLTIVGDVKFDNIKSLVEDLFGNWKKGKSLNYSMPQTSNLNDLEISFVDMPNAVQSEIYVGNLMEVSMSNPDFFALKLGNQILGGSSTARLFMNLREDKGFTYGSYSSASTSRYVGTFTATASVRNEVTDSAVTEIINEIKKITSVNVTEAELNAAKEKYVGSFIMSTEQPSTIASFASNIDKFNLPENFYEKYLENFQGVTVDDVKRVINKYILNDRLRILVVGKGQDVLSRLENLPYEMKYYDKYAVSSGKPDYSTPSDVSVESVISKYIEAIGGKDKISEVNAVSMLAEAEVQGMKLQMVSIQSKPNKQVTMMMMMGNTMMKMVFDGEKGSVSQQGIVNSLPEDQVQEMINSTLPFEELGWVSDDNVKFNSIEEEDGKTLHVLEVSKGTFVAYDSETGLKYKQTEIAEMPDGSKMPQTTYYDDYRSVDGVLFPYVIRAPIGPQSLDFNIVNISVNPQVSDSDFVIEN